MNETAAREYSVESFWRKIAGVGVKAGKALVEKALTLYYVLVDKDTPAWAKAIIFGALGYFIMPLDALPDPIYVDDLGAVSAALVAVAAHVKEPHIEQAKAALAKWCKRKRCNTVTVECEHIEED